MGKKTSWFAAVRSIFKSNAKDSDKVKVFVTEYNSEEKINEVIVRNKTKICKGKGRWSFGKFKQIEDFETAVDQNSLEKRTSIEDDDEQDKHALAVAAASAAAAEAAVAAAYAAAEVVRLTGGAQSPSVARLSKRLTEAAGILPPVIIEKEDWAAIRIQTAFRGYLARRALRALRGLVRLQALVRGQAVRRQASRTFRCMQALVRLQARLRAISTEVPNEENGDSQWTDLKGRLANIPEFKVELGESEMEKWDASVQSLEEKLLRRLSRKEAALKRERALAYAVSRQPWRCSPQEGDSSGTDHESDKLQRRWTWLDRWMAARSRQAPFFDVQAYDHSVNEARSRIRPTAAEFSIPRHSVTKYADFGRERVMKGCEREAADCQAVTMTPQRQSFTLGSNAEEQSLVGTASSICSLSRKFGSLRSVREGSSIAGDDDSIASSPHVPNYMSSTHSAKAKSRTRSLSTPKQRTAAHLEGEHLMPSSARKRLSFPAMEGLARSTMSTPKHPQAFGLAEQSSSLACFPVSASD